MAARIVHCLGAGVCEALPVQLVNDIFFLHERGVQLGYYTCNSGIPRLIRRPLTDVHLNSCIMPCGTCHASGGIYALY